MKSLALCFIFLVSIPFLSAAQNFVPFGELTRDEKEMKQCDFDKDADAIVLLHEAISNYDDQYHLITKHHIRVKILKEKGIADNANVSIRYWRDADFEKINVTRAGTINATDGGDLSIAAVERKAIFNQKINGRIGEVSFAFPAVKVGSILEYEYESEMDHYGGLEDWYFQEKLPVLSSRYKLVIVPNTEFTYKVVKRADFNAIVTPNDKDYSVYFEMNKIPGLRYEPYMDARKDYLQKVWIQLSRYRMGDSYGGSKYMTSWDEVNRELSSHESFSRYIGKSVPDTDTFIARIKSVDNPVERLKKVFDFVRGRMKWNRVYGIYLSDGFKEAWTKRTGTCAEINMILLNLLKESGVDASPALVSHRNHGKVDPTYPFIGQFNTFVVRAIVNNHTYYLDASDEYTPYNLVPVDLLNTIAFVIGKKKGELVDIMDESLGYRERILVTAKVSEDGKMEGNIEASSEEYAKVEKMETLLSEGQSEFSKEYFNSDNVSVSTENLRIDNKDNDSLPLLQRFQFNAQLTENGGYFLLPVNLFSGLAKNPFTSDNRFSNINLGYSKSITVVVKTTLPDGFVVDELPKAIKMMTPDKDIEMTRVVEYNKEDKMINAMLQVSFSQSYYVVDDYPMLKEFYKKLVDFLNEPVVLKKK